MVYMIGQEQCVGYVIISADRPESLTLRQMRTLSAVFDPRLTSTHYRRIRSYCTSYPACVAATGMKAKRPSHHCLLDLPKALQDQSGLQLRGRIQRIPVLKHCPVGCMNQVRAMSTHHYHNAHNSSTVLAIVSATHADIPSRRLKRLHQLP